MKRPEYVPQHSRRASWPISERSGREPAPARVDPMRYLIVVVAAVVLGTTLGVIAVSVWGAGPAEWVWP